MDAAPPPDHAVDGSLLPLFRSLANPHRLHVFQALAQRPLRGKEVSEACGITPQEASRHLGRLAVLGLVERGPDRAHRLTELGRRLYHELQGIAATMQAAKARPPEPVAWNVPPPTPRP